MKKEVVSWDVQIADVYCLNEYSLAIVQTAHQAICLLWGLGIPQMSLCRFNIKWIPVVSIALNQQIWPGYLAHQFQKQLLLESLKLV